MPDSQTVQAEKDELNRALTRAEIAEAKMAASEKELVQMRNQLQLERLHHQDELAIAEEDRRRSVEQAEQREHFLHQKIEELEQANRCQQAVINGHMAQQHLAVQSVPVVAVPMTPIFGSISIPIISIPEIPYGLYQWIPSSPGIMPNSNNNF